ncbi:hypothetical protein LMG26686_03231 [Achromobacter mucicolens]|jgi:hypothetical protein|nr:hypothetical protein LMG26686_03231 [Achromobacter mucicolens]
MSRAWRPRTLIAVHPIGTVFQFGPPVPLSEYDDALSERK